jgi:MFS family permease
VTTSSSGATFERGMGRARRRLMPFLGLMYILNYLDRVNIGYAKEGLQASTGISDAEFALAAGIFTVSYAVFELPSNLVLHRIGARTWLARIMVTWGVLAAGMALISNERSFVVLRVLLGVAEAGFFPGVLLYLTYWFPASERGRILGLFYLGQPLCFIFGGPLSGVLLDLDGRFGLRGWQLMFAVEGLLAVLVGVIAFFYLTDRPARAHWMREEERAALVTELEAEDRAKAGAGRMHLGAALRDPVLLHFALIYLSIAMCGYGIAFYLPVTVGALLGRRVGLYVSLVTAVPWLCAFAACAVWPGLAVRVGRRRSFCAFALLCAGAGMIASGYLGPLAGLVALCVGVAGVIAAQPIFWTFPSGYFGGYAAAGGIAIVNSIGNLGGFVGPNLKVAAETYTGTSVAGVWVIGGGALVAAMLVLLIPRRVDGAVAETPLLQRA